MLRYLPFLLILAVWIYAFIDCLNTPEQEVRKLPKVAWVIIILLFGQVLLGPVAWFAVGRPRREAPYGATRPQERRWVAPDDNPDFLKSLGQDGPSAPRDPEQDARSAPADDTAPETGPPHKPPQQKPQPGEEHAESTESAESAGNTGAAGTAENTANETPEDRRRGPEDPPR